MVKMTLHEIDFTKGLTSEELAQLEAAEKMPIVYDDDCPELTEEQLAEFKRISDIKKAQKNKQTVTLRLSPQALAKAKSLGKGYTSVLTRILELGLSDNELIKKCL